MEQLDVNGTMLVWCRECSGCTRVTLGGTLLNHCQLFVDEGITKRMYKITTSLKKDSLVRRIGKLNGQRCATPGRIFQRLKE